MQDDEDTNTVFNQNKLKEKDEIMRIVNMKQKEKIVELIDLNMLSFFSGYSMDLRVGLIGDLTNENKTWLLKEGFDVGLNQGHQSIRYNK